MKLEVKYSVVSVAIMFQRWVVDNCAPQSPVSIRIWKMTKLEQMNVSQETVHQDSPVDEPASLSRNVADDADGAASDSVHQDLPVDKSAGESDAQSKGSGNVADNADGAASDSAQQKGRGRENKGQTSSEAAKHIAKANCLGNELKEENTKLAAKPTGTETPKPEKRDRQGKCLLTHRQRKKRQN